MSEIPTPIPATEPTPAKPSGASYVLSRIRKALIAFVVPNIPAIVAFVTARWGTAIASEVVAVLSALGVYSVPNDPPK